MSKETKISSSVVSHVGIIHNASTNSFFSNGTFTHNNLERDVQASIQSVDSVQVYAVSSNMEFTTDDGSRVSFSNDLKKYLEKNRDRGNINEKYEKLLQTVTEATNLAASLIQDDTSGEVSFAGMFISEGKMGALSYGDSRVYMFRNGNIKQLTSDFKKTERLLKMGIITDDQAESISDRLGIEKNIEDKVKKIDLTDIKQGDVFVLCSNGMLDYLDDESLVYILSMEEDSGYITSTLADEILKRQKRDDVTVQVIKIDSHTSPTVAAPYTRAAHAESRTRSRTNSFVSAKNLSKAKVRQIKKIIRLSVFTVIIFALIFGVFLGLNALLFPGEDKPVDTQTPIENGSDNNDDNTSPTTAPTAAPTSTPSSTPTPTPTPAPSDTDTVDNRPIREYTVKQGDTLWSISVEFYGTGAHYTKIMETNNITDADDIKYGNVLTIPYID